LIISRRLLVLNGLIGLVACLLAAALIRELLTPLPLPPPVTPRPAPPVSVSAPASEAPALAAYGVITAKNLFSPSRSEAPGGPTLTKGPKPFLHGVVMNGRMSRAFLEDPVAKRTFGYSIGDTVAGGRVESISADRVVIARPEGLVEVLLQDPAKPRAAAAAPVGAPTPAPAVPATAAAAPGPGTPVPRVLLPTVPERSPR
jgi:hypothetical protein